MRDTPVIIEAAINGTTTRDRNPHVPLTPEEIAADAVACIDAGASIIHLHLASIEPGESSPGAERWGPEAAAGYAEIGRMLLAERPDALWYPSNTTRPTPDKNAHLASLIEQVPVYFGTVDPGTTNVGFLDEDGSPRGGAFVNDYATVWQLAAELRAWRLGASMGVFEPGFLRTTLALHRLGLLPRGSFVKLYFFGEYIFGRGPGLSCGLPPTEAAFFAYHEMLGGADLPWCVSAPGGDLARTPLPARALELGGHLHVGLEFHFDVDRKPTNVELVEEAVSLAKASGRSVASTAEAAEILDLPRRPGDPAGR